MACGVELVEQTSRSLCIRNFSFGCLNRSTIWASECRGKFLCKGGDAFECGTPPGSAQYFCDCGGARVDRFEFTTGSKWRDPAADLRRTRGGKARFKPLSSSEMAKCGVELVEQTSRLHFLGVDGATAVGVKEVERLFDLLHTILAHNAGAVKSGIGA